MKHLAVQEDRPLVAALFSALDLACDHSDTEVIRRLSRLLDRLAAQGGDGRRPLDSGTAG